MDTLSKKHRLFVEAYDGDEVQAMRLAGYSGTNSYLKAQGEELLSLPLIQEAIKTRTKYSTKVKQVIMTREDRQALWSAIAMNQDPHRKPEFDSDRIEIPEGNIPLTIRLKATELLGKSEADFVDKVEMNVSNSLTDLITQSYKVPESIEDIEAEYRLLQEQKALHAHPGASEAPSEAEPQDFPTLEDLI